MNLSNAGSLIMLTVQSTNHSQPESKCNRYADALKAPFRRDLKTNPTRCPTSWKQYKLSVDVLEAAHRLP